MTGREKSAVLFFRFCLAHNFSQTLEAACRPALFHLWLAWWI